VKRAVVIAALASIAAATACEKLTHVSDFSIPAEAGVAEAGEPPATPADEICRRCANVAGAADLRHPPCPTEGSGDDGQVYVYAWRRFRLGVSTDPSKTTKDPSSYDTQVGYDLDCSERLPDGLPVKCAAILPDGGSDAEKYPWEPWPRGIDNALGQRFLGPLFVSAYNLDMTTQSLDDQFSQQLELGKGSILTIVYGWNGTDDDKKVSVRIVSAAGVVGADTDPSIVPKWDGTDKWVAGTAQADPEAPEAFRDQVPLVNSKTDDAYVAGGVLVVDYSFLKPLYNHIVKGGVVVEVPLYDMHMVAKITQDALSFEQFFGRWPLASIAQNNDQIASFLGACDPNRVAALKFSLPVLTQHAADFLVDDSQPPSTTCDALTVTYAADAQRASIGGYKALSSMPSQCPP
jgi:hypothetical protein